MVISYKNWYNIYLRMKPEIADKELECVTAINGILNYHMINIGEKYYLVKMSEYNDGRLDDNYIKCEKCYNKMMHYLGDNK